MPSPLPKNLTNFLVQIGSVHNDRQLLALYAGKVIAAWANLEVTMAMLFNAMLKGDPMPAAAIFNSIRSENGQRDAFRALSAVAIPDPEDRDILEVVLAKVRSAGKNRHVIAHHLWGLLPELPDAIVFVDPDGAAASHLRFTAAASKETPSFEELAATQELIRSIVSVWRESDFIEANDRIARAIGMATTFIIMLPQPQRPSRDETARQMLLSDPEVAEFLRRSAQNRKTAQQAHP